uniref:Immunoglobulin domain-containing protein n=1 Tax=Acanthochromis polyacanthus TaxID=80966 RepID=A0A3Q1FX39_9TELE
CWWRPDLVFCTSLFECQHSCRILVEKSLSWCDQSLQKPSGYNVTLSCHSRSSTSLPSDFYKDDVLIGTNYSGSMTMLLVSKSDEGIYRCKISGHGESPSSWLFVRGELNRTRNHLSRKSDMEAVTGSLVKPLVCDGYLSGVCFFQVQMKEVHRKS